MSSIYGFIGKLDQWIKECPDCDPGIVAIGDRACYQCLDGSGCTGVRFWSGTGQETENANVEVKFCNLFIAICDTCKCMGEI